MMDCLVTHTKLISMQVVLCGTGVFLLKKNMIIVMIWSWSERKKKKKNCNFQMAMVQKVYRLNVCCSQASKIVAFLSVCMMRATEVDDCPSVILLLIRRMESIHEGRWQSTRWRSQYQLPPHSQYQTTESFSNIRYKQWLNCFWHFQSILHFMPKSYAQIKLLEPKQSSIFCNSLNFAIPFFQQTHTWGFTIVETEFNITQYIRNKTLFWAVVGK